MEDKTSPDKSGKKKFSIGNFFFGWMKPSPKIDPKKEDGTIKTPDEIEAEKKDAKKNAPKKGSALPLIVVLLLIIAGIAIWQYTSKDDGKQPVKKEKTQPGPGTQPTQPGQPGPGTQPTQPGQPGPGTQPTQPGTGTQPTQPGQPNQPQTTVTFEYDKSYDWSQITESQEMLKKLETSYPVYVNASNILLKYEIKGYGGKNMIWLQIDGPKGKTKHIFTTPDKVNLIY